MELLTRRRALGLLAGAGVVGLAACSSDPDSGSNAADTAPSTTATTSTTSTTGTTAASATDASTPIPEETAGPFPGDGTNGPNVLTDDGIVRRDIRDSFGSASGTAEGVPLTIELRVVDSTKDGTPLAGAAVYVWHCDREGRYSLYSPGATDRNYLRGVQEVAADGKVTFTSIFPAAYQGRWPHIHFEVYPSVAEATRAGTPTATSQLALPEATCDAVYATDGYEQSVRNLAGTSLQRDMVFRDDSAVHQLAAMSGSVSAGYTAALTVPVEPT